jgi:hypothetical protein
MYGLPLLALATCAAIAVLGCNQHDKPKPAAEAPAVTSDAPAPSDSPKAPPPDDIDLTALQASMKCPGTTFKAACEILDEFKKGTAWDFTLIHGADARYFGRGVEATASGVVERYFFLIARRVPLNEVSGSDLPIKQVFRPLESSREVEIAQAPKLLRLLEKDDAVSKTIQTAKYVLEYAPATWEGAAASKGISTFAQTGSGAYVRMVDRRRLVWVQPAVARPGGSAAEGTYAILYPLSW